MARSSPKFRALATFHEHIFNSLRSQQWDKARALRASPGLARLALVVFSGDGAFVLLPGEHPPRTGGAGRGGAGRGAGAGGSDGRWLGSVGEALEWVDEQVDSGPAAVVGYWQMMRGHSFRSDRRVPTHIAILLGASAEPSVRASVRSFAEVICAYRSLLAAGGLFCPLPPCGAPPANEMASRPRDRRLHGLWRRLTAPCPAFAGQSMSIERLVQAVGRATFTGGATLRRNGFEWVTYLGSQLDFRTAVAYPHLLLACYDALSRGHDPAALLAGEMPADASPDGYRCPQYPAALPPVPSKWKFL